MPSVLLLNPNTNTQTTQMMVQLVQAQLPASFAVHGITATRSSRRIWVWIALAALLASGFGLKTLLSG